METKRKGSALTQRREGNFAGNNKPFDGGPGSLQRPGPSAKGGNGASDGTVVLMRRPGGEKKRAEFREGIRKTRRACCQSLVEKE